jgi:dipeptidyl aminopeptidase/acylaminoacyl peptidase
MRIHTGIFAPLMARQLFGLPLVLFLLLAGPGIAAAQPQGSTNAQEKRALDHGDYELWNRIQQESLSPDGRWLTYRIAPGKGDATLHLVEVDGSTSHAFAQGTGARFTRDGRFFVVRIQPTEAAREAQREAANGRNAETLRDSLVVVDLGQGSRTGFDRVRGFTVPSERSDWIFIHREAPPAQRAAAGDSAAAPTPAAAANATPGRNRPQGTDLHWRNLATGEERVIGGVTEYTVSGDGSQVIYVVSTRDGEGNGVFHARAGTENPRALLGGVGEIQRVTVDRDFTQIAFFSNRDTFQGEDDPVHVLYHARLSGSGAGTGEAQIVVTDQTPGIPSGWTLATAGTVSFSRNGDRLFFGTAPRPEPEPEEKDELLQNVQVDIWSWHDGFLQSQQLLSVAQDRRRTYEAVLHLRSNRVIQLTDPSLQSISFADGRNSDLAIGQDELPYRQRVSWDTRYVDLYLVNVVSGARELLMSDVRGGSLSPEGRFLHWFDGEDTRQWWVMDLASRQSRAVTAGVPTPLWNELNDTPSPPGSYGLAGWTAGDRFMVVQDAHDLWLVDPQGQAVPRNLTAGYGRQNGIRLRPVRLGWEDSSVPLDQEILLTATNLETYAEGFYRTTLSTGAIPTQVVMEDMAIASPSKAEDAERYLFTKRRFDVFPDLWVSSPDYRDQRQMTRANPQQDEFVWGTAELVEWTSVDGEPLKGILYKPENFDPSQKWPMMVYFYERSSSGLHGYTIPGPGTSINRSFYVSRGYLLFVPDIPYKEGYPGESAMNAVIPGILSIVDQGYVDRAKIGVQGHSWGGYQIAYMVTRTNLFAAAEVGAPVVNMTSAYGGIRWESGRVRQMQYEQGQSRIGATLWEAQHRYIENSPLFTAYKIETPLLILHNDEDGAVPWEEGIQFFVALRRLGKPAWLVNYNGEAHGIRGTFNQRDWTIRMAQFFDHYLKDTPPPVWMVEGVPAIQKGRTLGLDLVADPVTNGGGRD